jgi:hypothetical protein
MSITSKRCLPRHAAVQTFERTERTVRVQPAGITANVMSMSSGYAPKDPTELLLISTSCVMFNIFEKEVDMGNTKKKKE